MKRLKVIEIVEKGHNKILVNQNRMRERKKKTKGENRGGLRKVRKDAYD